MKDFNEIFNNLSQDWFTADKCSFARQQKDPLPCEWSKVAGLEYCKVHQGIKVKPNVN